MGSGCMTASVTRSATLLVPRMARITCLCGLRITAAAEPVCSATWGVQCMWLLHGRQHAQPYAHMEPSPSLVSELALEHQVTSSKLISSFRRCWRLQVLRGQDPVPCVCLFRATMYASRTAPHWSGSDTNIPWNLSMMSSPQQGCMAPQAGTHDPM